MGAVPPVPSSLLPSQLSFWLEYNFPFSLIPGWGLPSLLHKTCGLPLMRGLPLMDEPSEEDIVQRIQKHAGTGQLCEEEEVSWNLSCPGALVGALRPGRLKVQQGQQAPGLLSVSQTAEFRWWQQGYRKTRNKDIGVEGCHVALG